MTKRYDITGVGPSVEIGPNGNVLSTNAGKLTLDGDAIAAGFGNDQWQPAELVTQVISKFTQEGTSGSGYISSGGLYISGSSDRLFYDDSNYVPSSTITGFYFKLDPNEWNYDDEFSFIGFSDSTLPIPTTAIGLEIKYKLATDDFELRIGELFGDFSTATTGFTFMSTDEFFIGFDNVGNGTVHLYINGGLFPLMSYTLTSPYSPSIDRMTVLFSTSSQNSLELVETPTPSVPGVSQYTIDFYTGEVDPASYPLMAERVNNSYEIINTPTALLSVAGKIKTGDVVSFNSLGDLAGQLFNSSNDQLVTGEFTFDVSGGRSFYAGSITDFSNIQTQPEKVFGIFDHPAGFMPTALLHYNFLYNTSANCDAGSYSMADDDGTSAFSFAVSSAGGEARISLGGGLTSTTAEMDAVDFSIKGRNSLKLVSYNNYSFTPSNPTDAYSIVDLSNSSISMSVSNLLATPDDNSIVIDATNITLSAPNGSVLVNADPTDLLGVATKQYVDNKFPTNAAGYLLNDGSGGLSWVTVTEFDAASNQTITGNWSFDNSVTIDGVQIGGTVSTAFGVLPSSLYTTSTIGVSGLIPTPLVINSDIVDGHLLATAFDATLLGNSEDIETGITVRDDIAGYTSSAFLSTKKGIAGDVIQRFGINIEDDVSGFSSHGVFRTDASLSTSTVYFRASDSVDNASISLDADGTVRAITVSADTITINGEALLNQSPTQNMGVVNKQYAYNMANYRALVVDFDYTTGSEIIIGTVPENSIIVNWSVYTDVFFDGVTPATLSLGNPANNSGIASVADIDLNSASVDSLRTFFKVGATPANLIMKGYFTLNDSTQGSGSILIEYYAPAI